jgi:hypothetical protein
MLFSSLNGIIKSDPLRSTELPSKPKILEEQVLAMACTGRLFLQNANVQLI